VGGVHARRAAMRKGQVTLFIIVGIVILFSLAFGVYLMSSIQAPDPEFTPVQNTEVKACLEQVSEQAVEDILLRASTGAPSELTAEQVRIAIRQGSPLTVEQYQASVYKQLGLFNLQPLCLADGPNRPNAAGDGMNSCFSPTYQLFEHDTEVLQHALQEAIRAYMADACGQYGQVTVIFGGDDVTVRTENATATVPVRFKRIYNAGFVLLQQEVMNLEHDLRSPLLPGCDEPANGNDCLVPGLAVNADTSVPNTLITIVDSATKLHGQSPYMRLVIENRHPVITAVTGSTAATGKPSPSMQAIIVTHLDPDEDDVTVIVSPQPGWLNVVTDDTVRPHVTRLELTPSCSAVSTTLLVRVRDEHGSENTRTIPITVTQDSTCP
jgi:hypothetical protein